MSTSFCTRIVYSSSQSLIPLRNSIPQTPRRPPNREFWGWDPGFLWKKPSRGLGCLLEQNPDHWFYSHELWEQIPLWYHFNCLTEILTLQYDWQVFPTLHSFVYFFLTRQLLQEAH